MAVFEADGRERGRNRNSISFPNRSCCAKVVGKQTREEKKSSSNFFSTPRKKESSWTSQHIFLLSFLASKDYSLDLLPVYLFIYWRDHTLFLSLSPFLWHRHLYRNFPRATVPVGVGSAAEGVRWCARAVFRFTSTLWVRRVPTRSELPLLRRLRRSRETRLRSYMFALSVQGQISGELFPFERQPRV